MDGLRQRIGRDSSTGSYQALLPEPTSETKGRPILVVKNGDSFELDERALRKVLYQNHVKDKKVVVVSVAGAYRRGKSFLLDFLLRYLRAEGRPDWMGPDDIPLEGFPWRYGSSLHTTGILIWSEVFLSKLPNGEEVAVILMDTQGAFDIKSTVQDCATIFALSTLLSSVQIYNLMHNIQEDDLQHLQLFTDYGRLALGHCDMKPFQKLQFLVRDWQWPGEKEYGEDGGKKLLDEWLQTSSRQNAEKRELRQYIKACFSDISCFLMPHPGPNVATKIEFDGKLSDIDSEFKNYLEKLVPLVLAPESLMVKEIGGNKVTAKQLFTYFKSYFDIFRSGSLPAPKTIFAATVEASHLTAVAEAKEAYRKKMQDVCDSFKAYIFIIQIESEHAKAKDVALAVYQNKGKMNSEELSEKYQQELEEVLDMLLGSYKTVLNLKRRNYLLQALLHTGFGALNFTLLKTFQLYKLLP